MRQALAGDDLTAWASADDVFHRALIDRCGNGRIARIAGTIMDQSHRARMLTLRMRAKPVRSIEQHQAIIDAIAHGDATLARRHARDHRARAPTSWCPCSFTWAFATSDGQAAVHRSLLAYPVCKTKQA